MKWEYIVLYRELTIANLTDILNLYGKEGWELIDVKIQSSRMFSNEYMLIFKRPC